jgi:hypothetical protein
MTRLDRALQQFLEETGRLKEPVLGGPAQRRISAGEVEKLHTKLTALAQRSRRLSTLLVLLYVILFVVLLVAAVHYREEPTKLNTALGVIGASVAGLLRGIRDVWRQQSALDVLVAIIPNLPPEEVARVAESLFFSTPKEQRKH